MMVNVPKVSGRLRERSLELAADPSNIVNRCYTLLAESEESYTNLPSAVRQDILHFLEFSAKLWFNSLLNGTFPRPEETEILADAGRRRVHQGVSLSSLLRAFRYGGREVWNSLLALADDDRILRDELLFDVSRYLLEYFDLTSQIIAKAYMDEEFERLRWRDSLRYELSSIVFQFPDDLAGFHRAADSLGLDPTAARIALALDVKLPQSTPSKLQGEFDRIALGVSRQLKIAYDDLVRVFHRGRLVIWVPCIRGDTVLAADRRVTDSAGPLIKAMPEILGIGIGLMNQGPAGWAQSVDEAFKALESATRSNPGKRLYLYSDIVVNESVRRTDNVLRYLNSLLERLATEPELLTTLQTYFDHQQRRKVAADVLGIHPNTLNHRLERIETLLGARLDDAGWVAKLYVAVKLRQESISEPDGEA
jgi:carbohydrate diacid regulator